MPKINNIIGLFIIFLLVGTYFFTNIIHFDFSPEQLTGYGEPYPFPSDSLGIQLLVQILYLSLAGTGVVFLASFSQWNKIKLFWIIIISLILLIAYNDVTGSSLHGRYIDCLIPLLIVGAFTYEWKEDRRILAFGSGLMLFSFLTINTFWRDTINSSSNIYTYYPWLIPLLFVASLIFLLKIKNKKTIVTTFFIVLLITFTISNVTNFQYLKQASDNAYENCEIGRYINNHNLEGVVFDENDYRDWWASYCLLSYYHGDFIPLGNSIDDYFTSSQDLQYEILAEQEQFKILEEDTNKTLYLYKKWTKVSRIVL